jgi:hypothetical protein
MSKYLLDESNGTRVEMWFDDFDDSFRFVETQDASRILDENKRKFNDYGDYLSVGKRGFWHHTHSIPKPIYQKWKNETKVPNGEGGWLYMIEQDPKVLASYLNDPDYAYFRTSNTKL